MMRSIQTFILIFLLFFTMVCYAEKNEPPKIGNFSLPYSQQPGPFLSLGENILEKHETQLFLYADDIEGTHQQFVDVAPQIAYGINDALSLFISAPYAASYQTASEKSSGWADSTAQLEYAFYVNNTSRYTDQATIVFNASIPTGSAELHPPTGLNSPSFLVGTTFNITGVHWFFFDSPGVIFTTNYHGTEYGNNYLYQFGFGRNFLAKDGWILAWVTEINGTYTEKNQVYGVADPNSGGNIINLISSLWASTKYFIFQCGIGFPIEQNLYGNQPKNTYLIAANIGWSFF